MNSDYLKDSNCKWATALSIFAKHI